MIEKILIATSKNDVNDSNDIISTYFNTNIVKICCGVVSMCYIEYMMFYLYSGVFLS